MNGHASHTCLFNKYYVPTIRFLLSKKNSASDADSFCLLKSGFKFKSPFPFWLPTSHVEKWNIPFTRGHVPIWSPASLCPPLCYCSEDTQGLALCFLHPPRKHTSICDFNVGVTISALDMVVFVSHERPTTAPHGVTLESPKSLKPRVFPQSSLSSSLQGS